MITEAFEVEVARINYSYWLQGCKIRKLGPIVPIVVLIQLGCQ